MGILPTQLKSIRFTQYDMFGWLPPKQNMLFSKTMTEMYLYEPSLRPRTHEPAFSFCSFSSRSFLYAKKARLASFFASRAKERRLAVISLNNKSRKCLVFHGTSAPV